MEYNVTVFCVKHFIYFITVNWVSKRVFSGAQMHEYYIALRSMMPWDAGDKEFEFDLDADIRNGYKIVKANGNWYSRHNLNFSFCADGRNPLSGYSVVFGGNDNTETLLLRRGTIVARRPDVLFGKDESHLIVHWNWWKFTVRKNGVNVSVLLNDNLLFRYADPEPLEGGHIAFWTVRNGFVVARVVSMAEDITSTPQVLYVPEDAESIWQPLVRDAVTVTRQPGEHHTKVTANVGAGFLGVRYVPPEPIDLKSKPVFKLPIRIPAGTKVNAYLQISGKAYVVQLTAPLEQTKALLAPEFEKGECFRIPVIAEADLKSSRVLTKADPDSAFLCLDLIRLLPESDRAKDVLALTAVTIGNSSNKEYLLAGSNGNLAGAWYSVGTPVFVAEGE